jgi:hypothetical protein
MMKSEVQKYQSLLVFTRDLPVYVGFVIRIIFISWSDAKRICGRGCECGHVRANSAERAKKKSAKLLGRRDLNVEALRETFSPNGTNLSNRHIILQ